MVAHKNWYNASRGNNQSGGVQHTTFQYNEIPAIDYHMTWTEMFTLNTLNLCLFILLILVIFYKIAQTTWSFDFRVSAILSRRWRGAAPAPGAGRRTSTCLSLAPSLAPVPYPSTPLVRTLSRDPPHVIANKPSVQMLLTWPDQIHGSLHKYFFCLLPYCIKSLLFCLVWNSFISRAVDLIITSL